MDKKTLNGFQEKLEIQKAEIEKELQKFATKDKGLKGDWDTKYPESDKSSSGSSQLEDAAGEVEQYATLLPIEYSLELRLQKINEALEKIKKGDYGICKTCGKKIAEDRLRAYPEAEFCKNCQKN